MEKEEVLLFNGLCGFHLFGLWPPYEQQSIEAIPHLPHALIGSTSEYKDKQPVTCKASNIAYYKGNRKTCINTTQPPLTDRFGQSSFHCRSDHNFMELVLENGQILIRGPSGRTDQWSASCTANSSSSCTSKVEKRIGGDTIIKKIARLGILDQTKSSSNYDKMDPFLNHRRHDDYSYCHNHDGQPELLPELCEANPNAPFKHYANAATINTASHVVSLHHYSNSKPGNASKIFGEDSQPSTGHRNGHLCQFDLQQCQASSPHVKSFGLDFIGNMSKNSSESLMFVGGLPNSKIQEQDSVHSKKMGLMNFSHFLRPSCLVKANNQSTDATRSSQGSSRAVKLSSGSAEDFSNPVGSSLINSASGSENVIGLKNQAAEMAGEVGFRPLATETPKEPLSHRQSKAVCQEDPIRNNRSHDQAPCESLSFAASAVKGKPDTVRSVDPLPASSSACSRGVSNDLAYTMKRKYQETESTYYYSDDMEEEPDGVKKQVPTRGSRGAKRNRSADMHNLSERKRRDKISKKMRALQKLIPNCNKVDKASMLDEAIEYMKTLQLQVQIMSMRSGLYMPPMMLPSGMQQIHAPHWTHYSPMGIRMGLGMGIGSSISGATALPGFQGIQLQRLGLPSQVLPMPPFTTMPGGSSA